MITHMPFANHGGVKPGRLQHTEIVISSGKLDCQSGQPNLSAIRPETAQPSGHCAVPCDRQHSRARGEHTGAGEK